MRLKGIKIRVKQDGEVVVVPLYFKKGAGTRTAPHLAVKADSVVTAVQGLLGKLLDRGDLAL